MQWKFEGSSPVYLQIMEHIRQQVLCGEYGPGDRIPPVRELAVQANVNPNTMQRALMTLEQEKLLVTCGTTGRFVTDDPQTLQQLRSGMIEKLVKESAAKFKAMGLSLQEAAQSLLELENKEEA